MIIRNIILLLAAGLILLPSPGIDADPPPHEGLFCVFIECMKAEGVLMNDNIPRWRR